MLQRAQQNLGIDANAGSPSDQPHSADPILNDVLECDSTTRQCARWQFADETPASEMPQASGELRPDPKLIEERRYQVAESLLRSARLLQQLGATDPEQAQLIRAMRHRALALMIQSAASEKPSQPLRARATETV